MAKLYRVIPDSVATVCETAYISDISEDLFYKVGYISKNDHMYNYFRIRMEKIRGLKIQKVVFSSFSLLGTV